MATNLNYLLNKQYYKFDEEVYKKNNNKKAFLATHFDKCNKELIKTKFTSNEDNPIPFINDSAFTLKTVYPGLLFGIGNTHDAGTDYVSGDDTDGAQIKLGFTLDYVTGLPIIPGSTVKGVLKSAFLKYKDSVAKSWNIEVGEVNKIISDVFGDEDNGGKGVFYDAIPVGTDDKQHILGLENITPHTGGELKNPVPLTMLKVIPDVKFLFRFDLSECNEMYRNKLKGVFIDILTNLGIGAKTNVGFGIMERDDDTPSQCTKMLEITDSAVSAPPRQNERVDRDAQVQPPVQSQKNKTQKKSPVMNTPDCITKGCKNKAYYNDQTEKVEYMCLDCLKKYTGKI